MTLTSRNKSNDDSHSGIGRESQCAIEPLSALARLLARQAARDQRQAASDHFHQQTKTKMAPNTSKIDLSDDGETLLSPSEVASLDNVSTKTVLRWIKKGHLPAYKLEGLWRISPRDHRRFRRERWNG